MIHIKAPDNFVEVLEEHNDKHSIFLAGSIEQGKAIEWQESVAEQFKNSDVIILNPRRLNWDATWKQNISDPNFNKQVNWEMDALEYADHILMYLEPSTMAPISLLELGLSALPGKIWVCCPEGYWRRGNVQITCFRNDIPLYNNLDQMIKEFREDFNL